MIELLYLLMALLVVQLVLFGVSLAYQFSPNPASGWKSNILSGLGFLVMSANAFVCQRIVPAEQAHTTWLAGGVFLLFASFLLWLGVNRRRAFKSTADNDSEDGQ